MKKIIWILLGMFLWCLIFPWLIWLLPETVVRPCLECYVDYLVWVGETVGKIPSP